jgi:hypothetical protein
MVAEAKNLKSFGFDNRRSLCVGALSACRKVLTTVEFNDELGSMAQKIRDIALNRNLSAEARPAQPMIA